MDRKHTLHAFAVGDLPYRETLVEPGAVARDDNAFIRLNAFALAVFHLDHDAHGIAGREFRNRPTGLQLFLVLFLELLDDVHRSDLS